MPPAVASNPNSGGKRFDENRRPPALKEDRPPPHDLGMEKAVLGSMLLEPETCVPLAAERVGTAEAFYYPVHQRIYAVIVRIYEAKGKGIDILTISHALSVDGSLEEIGGEAYLLELQGSMPSTANIETWCDTLRNLYSLRKLIAICATTIDQCYETESSAIGEMFDQTERTILDVRAVDTSKGKPIKIAELINPAVKHLENLKTKDESVTGIPTGYSRFDQIIMGLKKQEMIVIAARPSIGKTSLAMNILSNVAVTKSHSAAFFSLEMSAEQLARRLLCGIARVSEKDFYEGRFGNDREFQDKWRRITKAAAEMKKANVFIDPTPGMNILQLRAKALRLHKKEKIEVIFIDYLQLLRADVSKGANRQEEVAKISVGIKSLAKELDIPIVVLAQLNRQAERDGARPKLSHLRESGAIEQDADIVAFLHRDRDAQKDTTKEALETGLEAELIVEKNRNGSTGIVPLRFRPTITTFEEPARISDEDIPR